MLAPNDPEFADRLEALHGTLSDALIQIAALQGAIGAKAVGEPVPEPVELTPEEREKRKKERLAAAQARRDNRVYQKIEMGRAMSEEDL